MASKKAAGKVSRQTKAQPKYRGVKKFGSEIVKSGNILVRQVGTKFHPGQNVGMGKDYTLFAKTDGVVQFINKKLPGRNKIRTYINIT